VATKQNIVGATVFSLGVDSGKQYVMGRLNIADVGPSFVHYDMQQEAGFNENFFKQLTAEVFEQRYEKGVLKEQWRKIRERNEALDCFVYATAAMELITPNFEQLHAFYSNNQQQQTIPAHRRRTGTLSRGVEV
jgi:phage terminase large subunit GpA-like protein